MQADDEDELLRSVAIQNAQSILAARQRAEQEILRAKEEVERASQELAHSLAMMRATLESTWDGILVTDERGNVTGFNERFVQMWQLPRGVMEARQHRQILDFCAQHFNDRGPFASRVEEIYAASPQESFDVLELADGRVFERYSRVQVVDAGNVGRVWSFRDLTEHRRAQEAAQQAAEERKHLLESERSARREADRASAMKDDFLAILSHELRTPLSAIFGWSQVLRARTMSAAELRQGLEIIERNARMQTQLIEDLLDMSRITSGRMRLDTQPVDLVSVIEAAMETVRPAAEAKAIRLTKLLDLAAGPIIGDPDRLQQVVWNLLSNAIKFTGKNGRVEVRLERVNSQIEITVADTGIGIAAEFLPHVFDRFRQADPSRMRTAGGLGLGLSIVKHLVEQHGGKVQVASPGEGGGATFTVCLPLTVVVHRDAEGAGRVHPEEMGASASKFRRSNLAGIRVLVVDDQADARELIKRVLEECHAEVLTAGAADEALRAVERDRPDVLVSDIGMPDVDGYELLRRVRGLGHTRGGGIPAIALTAFARSEDRTSALRAGFLVHVSKPVEPSELVATVASVVGRTGEAAAE
jgi:signal transduction histidine kinase/ActR/RegA family two-component response regulator